MKINLKNIVWLILGILLCLTITRFNPNRQNQNTVTISESIPQISTIPYPDFQYYQSLLKKEGLIIINTQTYNLIGKGEQLILTTIGEGCVSCHYNEIHIFDNKEEIFVFYGEETSLIPIESFGFIISQPVFKDNYSDRSEIQTAIYLWDGKTFIKTKTSPNWIDSPQIPG